MPATRALSEPDVTTMRRTRELAGPRFVGRPRRRTTRARSESPSRSTSTAMRGDLDLVGGEVAGEQRIERDRGFDRLGGEQLAERDIAEPDRAGEVGIDIADARENAAALAEPVGEALRACADPGRARLEHRPRARRWQRRSGVRVGASSVGVRCDLATVVLGGRSRSVALHIRPAERALDDAALDDHGATRAMHRRASVRTARRTRCLRHRRSWAAGSSGPGPERC